MSFCSHRNQVLQLAQKMYYFGTNKNGCSGGYFNICNQTNKSIFNQLWNMNLKIVNTLCLDHADLDIITTAYFFTTSTSVNI